MPSTARSTEGQNHTGKSTVKARAWKMNINCAYRSTKTGPRLLGIITNLFRPYSRKACKEDYSEPRRWVVHGWKRQVNGAICGNIGQGARHKISMFLIYVSPFANEICNTVFG